MSTLESYRKQARQLLRWHREGNYSVGGRIRVLPRYRTLTDKAALALRFPLAEAQEVIARENGYESWAALKAAVDAPAQSNGPASAETRSESRSSRTNSHNAPMHEERAPLMTAAIPILFVSNVQASADYFYDKLGFNIDFLHGDPPFYGSVSRDNARLHLRFVHEPVSAPDVVEREELLAAFVTVKNVKSLFAKYLAGGVEIHSRLKKEPWGGSGFTILDLDGNRIFFCEMSVPV